MLLQASPVLLLQRNRARCPLRALVSAPRLRQRLHQVRIPQAAQLGFRPLSRGKCISFLGMRVTVLVL